MFEILLVMIVGLILIDYIYGNHMKPCSEFKKIPGPKRTPLIGSPMKNFVNPVNAFNLFREMANAHRDAGLWKMNAMNHWIVCIYDPDDIQLILTNPKCLEKAKFYDLARPWLNDSVLITGASKWHARRKLLNPAFNYNNLQEYQKVFVKQSDMLVRSLANEVGKDECDIQSRIIKFSLQALTETSLGANATADQGKMDKYLDAINHVTHMGTRVIFLTSLGMKGILLELYKQFTDINKALDVIHDFAKSFIEQGRREKNAADREDDNAAAVKKERGILGLLLNAEEQGQIDEGWIRDEVNAFAFAGSETTARSIEYILMELANNPDIQDRLYAEIAEVAGDSSEYPTVNEMNDMRYLDMCVKEGMRLYPVALMFAREVYDEIALKNHTIPANKSGTSIFVQTFDVHRDPKLYPDPERYDPERFSAENQQRRHPYAFLAFSAGPRNCIGHRYAMIQMKIAVIAVLRKYRLHAVTKPSDLVFKFDIGLKTVDPIKFKLTPRE